MTLSQKTIITAVKMSAGQYLRYQFV